MHFICLLVYFFKSLLKNCTKEEEKTKLKSEHEMLVNKEKMGERFKLIALRKFDFQQAPNGF